jgi:HAD superfamily hydrolase (TIGR01509 family)
MIRAVIFDMDGVIVNSEDFWPELGKEHLTRLIPTLSQSDLKNLMGSGLRFIYKKLVKDYGVQISFSKFQSDYEQLANQVYTEKCSLSPGFNGVVEKLKANNLRLALASSSRRTWIQVVLERFQLKNTFEISVSGEDVRFEKPSADIYLFTAEKLGLLPQNCVAIEDSKNGVLSAKSADMYCIGFDNGHGQELSEADFVINGFSQLSVQKIEQLGTGVKDA